ncbi:MAG TPA: M13 family metallopeptidase N-terminal domain-containing protein, partial [Thermoanaerobaculaceae bacterium]|nr:M13 family metallopeptidase N-terminal domain-containing protein [Thermoanaerobaculaceae bacterium]
MKTCSIVLCVLLIPASMLAQTASTPPAPQPAQARPLTQLPYTPSLDIPSMDRTADPCVDFYQYTCGGWMKNNPIPPDQSSWSVYGKMYEENTRFLWGILEEASRPAEGRSAVSRQIGDYFAACMDEPVIEKAGAKPLDPALREIAAIKSIDDMARFVGRQHLEMQGRGMLFGFGSSQDFGDSTRFIAFADAGGLGLPDRDYYLKDDPKSKEIRQRYVAHVQRMLTLLGDTPEAATGAAASIMELESALAKAALTRVERRDPAKLHHLMPRAEWQALLPDFRLDLYLQAAGLPAYDVVNVTEPDFYRALQHELRSRDLKLWKDYLRWHLVNAEAPYLSSTFARADFDFYQKFLRGVAEQPARWKRCVELVDRDLGEALGQVFVAKTFTPDTKARALKMTIEIQKTMEEDIQQLPWMSPETKTRALEKLHAMVNKIGYPDRWRDYSSVVIGRDDFFGNVA